MDSHRGRDSTYSKISKRFFWYSVYIDVESYVKSCENCQKQGDFKLKTHKLHTSNFKRYETSRHWFSGLLEVDGYCYLIVSIDYFSKWSEAMPIADKIAPTIAQFL